MDGKSKEIKREIIKQYRSLCFHRAFPLFCLPYNVYSGSFDTSQQKSFLVILCPVISLSGKFKLSRLEWEDNQIKFAKLIKFSRLGAQIRQREAV